MSRPTLKARDLLGFLHFSRGRLPDTEHGDCFTPILRGVVHMKQAFVRVAQRILINDIMTQFNVCQSDDHSDHHGATPRWCLSLLTMKSAQEYP